MKATPKIQKYMTTMPHSIGADQPILKASEMMHLHNIRHLPVQNGGKLIGILTDRDVKMSAAFKDADTMTVTDAMIPDPYCCSPESTLHDVVLEMAEKKLGCALIVQDNGKLVGIFTAVDALRVLGEILGQHYKEI